MLPGAKTQRNPAVIYDLVRAIVQKVLQDKILMGLVVIGILAIFMGTSSMRDESASKSGEHEQAVEPAKEQSSELDPALATQFLNWWMPNAFDYAPSTAIHSHQQAFAWMTADAQRSFQTAFWTSEVAAGIASGKISASFSPAKIQAEAVNPDGSVVVGVSGMFTMQNGGPVLNQQLQTDFLIRKVPQGLRVAGIYSRMVQAEGSSVN